MNIYRVLILAIMAMIFLGCGGRPRSGDEVSGEAILLYNSGNDVQAMRLLRRSLGDGGLQSVWSTASQILIIHGKISGNEAEIYEGASIREDAKKRGYLSSNASAVAYDRYLMALLNDSEGEYEEAKALVARNCSDPGGCVLIDEMINGVLVYPNRLEAETVYLFSSILIKYHLGDDAVIAANLSSGLFVDYSKATSRMKAIREAGKFNGIIEEQYCLAIELIDRARGGACNK